MLLLLLLLHCSIVKIQIWDTAGQERFRTITRSYFRGADGIILVYNIADRRSFDSIRVWVQQIEKDGSTDVSKALVGNKCEWVGSWVWWCWVVGSRSWVCVLRRLRLREFESLGF
jgi:hypothetical protein